MGRRRKALGFYDSIQYMKHDVEWILLSTPGKFAFSKDNEVEREGIGWVFALLGPDPAQRDMIVMRNGGRRALFLPVPLTLSFAEGAASIEIFTGL